MMPRSDDVTLADRVKALEVRVENHSDMLLDMTEVRAYALQSAKIVGFGVMIVLSLFGATYIIQMIMDAVR